MVLIRREHFKYKIWFSWWKISLLYQNPKVSFPLSLPLIQFFFFSKAKSDLSEAVIGDYLLTARHSWASLVNPILLAISSESQHGREERGLPCDFIFPMRCNYVQELCKLWRERQLDLTKEMWNGWAGEWLPASVQGSLACRRDPRLCSRSQEMLSWKGPSRTIESSSWPCKPTSPCAQKYCPNASWTQCGKVKTLVEKFL